jgi:uncharacterized membrane protein YkoI
MNTRSVLALIAGTCLAASLQCAVAGDEDDAQAAALQKSGEIMSKDDILQKVRTEHPGKIRETELKKKGGQYIYEIDVVGDDGKKKEFSYDAKTGKFLSAENDDDDGDDDD